MIQRTRQAALEGEIAALDPDGPCEQLLVAAHAEPPGASLLDARGELQSTGRWLDGRLGGLF